MKTPKYTKLFVALVCASVIPLSLQAIPSLTLGNAIGYIAPGVDAATTTGTGNVNSLLAFAGGGSNPSDINFTYVVVTGGIYATAIYDSSGGVGGDNQVDATGFGYLAVKYDGDNGSLQVWDVFGLGTVSVPATDVFGKTSNKYYLFDPAVTIDPRGVPGTVPDGGSTVALLGLALIGLYSIRRQIASC